MYEYKVIPMGSRAHITAKKSPLWRFFNVFELSENMIIGQDQSLQYLDKSLLKSGNGGKPITELPDCIHIPPKNLFEIQDDSSNASRESLRHFMAKIFPDINANINAIAQQMIFGEQMGNANTKQQLG